jgi:chromosome segregation ATPase
MSFRDRATIETSALMTRVLASRSEHSRRELQALRRAFDTAAQAAEAALADIGGNEPAVESLIEELAAASRADAEAAAARVADDARRQIEGLQKEIQAKAAEQATLADTLKGARAETVSVRADLAREAEAVKSAKAELARVADACTRLQEARTELQAQLDMARSAAEDRVREAAERAQVEVKKAHDAASVRLEEARQQAQAAADAAALERLSAAQARKTLDQQIESLSEDLELARMESADVTKQLETEAAERAKLAAVLGRSQSQAERAQTALKDQLEKTAATEARLRSELATARHEADQAAANLATLRAEQEQGGRTSSANQAAQPLDRLLNVFQKLEQSRAVRDVLAAVVDGLASEFARVAVFEVNNNHLEILRQLGFDSDRDMSKVAIPLGIESLLTDAVTTGRIQSLSGPELADNNRPLFGGTPSFILVLPIAVGDQVLAVVYADDSDPARTEPSSPQNHVKFAQLLLWHAVPRLPRLIREERERADLHEYAAHLVQQIQDSYDADGRMGRTGDDLVKRLAENVKCARQMYEGRAGELPDSDAIFDERLAALADEARTSPFGNHLAAATGRKTSRHSAKKTRQVS